MYAVIKTGGKQYRVQAGDLLVVEKLDGEPGAEVAFGDVLLLGDGEAVTVGAPLVEGASVSATLIETRRGEKIKIFKKIRRQGYRRTRGHRQSETVLRVTSIAGAGKTAKWDGTVDLTPKALLDARARNLKNVVAELEAAAPAAPAKAKKAAAATDEAPAKKAAPKKAAAKKSDDAAE
ncbi:50S ribosomal protein L21 [Phenylobacterium sp.]|uniref:50S ribosomal protein L21 n=1 Tax=Phenylobacterium sp. TaxID=1871053 RepID=UPI00289F2645|nr:50S ribosomal protein L21 [Phenylobacterium sp.]